MDLAAASRNIVSRYTVRAVTLAAGSTGIVWLVVDALLLIDVLAARERLAVAGIPLACLAVQIGLLVLALARPGRATAILYLAVGALCVFAFQVIVLSELPDVQANGEMLLNRGAFTLALLGAVTGSALSGLVWCLSGFALGTLATLAASGVLGLPPRVAEGPVIAALTFSAVLVSLWFSLRLHDRRTEDLAAAEAASERMSAGRDAEHRAAALIHDTVLGDLTAIVHSAGPLTATERDRIEADAAALASVIERGGFPPPTRRSLQHDIREIVTDYESIGLRVDVSGHSAALGDLEAASRDAMLSAIRACLDNVVNHADTDSADVFIDRDAQQMTVMVVDHGTGFLIDDVSLDRLGIRNSIVGRLRRAGGSATIWTQPQIGTSVILSVPRDPAEVLDER
ncbi:hypothetical protein [Salinibacterium sp. ZJ454]|uniref:sensor histidine kinase n=1 Tax=Salinibacterium sp. ZJ454 TaxID=2708339 RepID=UPI00141F9D78|nr:hypothetical protein [Salinibacterium sp. ZJ454]